jgi:hypothetical protein
MPPTRYGLVGAGLVLPGFWFAGGFGFTGGFD